MCLCGQPTNRPFGYVQNVLLAIRLRLLIVVRRNALALHPQHTLPVVCVIPVHEGAKHYKSVVSEDI